MHLKTWMTVAVIMGTGLGGAGRAAANPLNLDAATALERREPNDRPAVISQVAPEYPAALRSAGPRGEVVVAFTVEIDGRVTEPEVLRSSQPEFEAPALAAIRQWRFRPAHKDGVVVASRLVQTLVFKPAPESAGPAKPTVPAQPPGTPP